MGFHVETRLHYGRFYTVPGHGFALRGAPPGLGNKHFRQPRHAILGNQRTRQAETLTYTPSFLFISVSNKRNLHFF
jgi:hypothetical protein